MNLRNILIGFLSLLFISAQAVPQDQLEISIDVQRHSERLLTLNVQGEVNIVALNSKKGIVVFDTSVSPVLARLVRERIEEEFDSEKFAYVINTHFHGDHTYGNQVFSDVPIIGHESCADDMQEREQGRKNSLPAYKAAVERMKAGLEKMDKDSAAAKELSRRIGYYQAMNAGLGEGFVLTPPTQTFSDSLSLDLGDITLELIFFGISHSPSDILIYCPEEGMWITGDLIAADYDSYIDSERVPYLPRWINNLKRIISTEEKTQIVVPGHGEFLSFDELKGELDFIMDAKAAFDGKESAFTVFKETFNDSDLETALKELRDMKAQEDKYYVLFPEIDQYAYGMMLDDKLDEALDIFKVMVDLFPDSDTAFDSLGEVYMRKEKTEMAIASFKKSLELNPDNRNASAKLKALQKK
ncbi:MAG: MBL fold metallo-hydrolase [Candidatus Aminicenantes bacterium]|nr:MBL fold metallo-hydrolase [Candidatus Aminicenantes bacterium]